MPEAPVFATPSKARQLQNKGADNSIIHVLSFESEVTPLQLVLIGKQYFCFYRYVWHDNQRYTQGFLVNSEMFLRSMTEPLMNKAGYSSLEFFHNQTLIQRIQFSKEQQEYALYSRTLAAPFQQLDLSIQAAKLAAVPGSLLVDLLTISLLGVFLIGFMVFYRLGCRQIELARQQQDFISAVSHELKTPLTSIRMYAEMLRSDWIVEESKKKQYYDFIFFESERLSRLISNVLLLARIGHQKQQQGELVSISAQTLLNKISSKVEVQIQASDFKLNIVPAQDKAWETLQIKVDEDAFFQIIINLLDNAIKFANTATKKHIDMGYSLSTDKEHLAFFIRDYGPGIKKNQRRKIFQLFYRTGDELTRITPGTGIGLALVSQLAKAMHAKVEVKNKHPGAAFQIKIPVLSEGD